MKKIKVRVAIAQINPTVGDLEGNSQKIIEYVKQAEKSGADIVCFPELALTGYPPEDLLLKPKFIQDNLKKIKELVSSVGNIIAVVGFVDEKKGNIFNSAAVIYQRKITGTYNKTLLPNYGVFDEKRYFAAGENVKVFQFGELAFGVNICEDIWHEGPVEKQVLSGARLVLNINASPYHMGKIKERQEVVQRGAQANKAAIVYANLVGGQDELVFDGQSMVVDAKGKIIARAHGFQEELLLVDLDIPVSKPKKSACIIISKKIPPKLKPPIRLQLAKLPKDSEEVYQALVLGVRDYVTKNNFKKVVLGLSGGVDSALVLTLAVDALGKDNVTAVFLPSQYSSDASKEDAGILAKNLGVNLLAIPIEDIYQLYLETLKPVFEDTAANIAEENLQARIRGNLLMALSNKFGWLVLTTGNKSEMSTGYATLYGDMAGGFAVIKDVPKELVYKLARYRNVQSCVMPERILTREPSAELKPNQKDSDTLPAYERLDPILKAYVEEDRDLESIVSLGLDREVVEKVLRMVDKSEYKRRQSPPGIKISPKAFGRDRRMPITNKYTG